MMNMICLTVIMNIKKKYMKKFKILLLLFFVCISLGARDDCNPGRSLVCFKKIVFEDIKATNELNLTTGKMVRLLYYKSSDAIEIIETKRSVVGGLSFHRCIANIGKYSSKRYNKDSLGIYIILQGTQLANSSNGKFFKISGFISSDIYYLYKMVWNGDLDLMIKDLEVTGFWNKTQLISIREFLKTDMKKSIIDLPIHSAILKLYLPDSLSFQAKPIMTIPNIKLSNLR